MDENPNLIQFSRSVMTTNLHGWMPPRSRRGHGGAQQFFDEIFSDGPVQELADAAASMKDFKASIRTLLSLGLCSLHHTRTVFVAPEPICRAPPMEMPCSPHGCLDILFRRVRALSLRYHACILSGLDKETRGSFLLCSYPGRISFAGFFLHSFS